MPRTWKQSWESRLSRGTRSRSPQSQADRNSMRRRRRDFHLRERQPVCVRCPDRCRSNAAADSRAKLFWTRRTYG